MTGSWSFQVLRTAISMALVGSLSLVTSCPVVAATGARMQDEARIHGKTYGEWSARWWQWQDAYFPQFEFGDGLVDCSKGQLGVVWFLAGVGPAGGSAARECDAPLKKGTHLFIPLETAALYNPDPNFCGPDQTCTIEEKREILDGIFSEIPAGIFNSRPCDLQINVDGIPAVFSAPIVRTQSPPFEYLGEADMPDPETIADGFWVMLGPLPSGEHTIEFGGGVCDIDTGEPLLSVDVTYSVTVR